MKDLSVIVTGIYDSEFTPPNESSVTALRLKLDALISRNGLSGRLAEETAELKSRVLRGAIRLTLENTSLNIGNSFEGLKISDITFSGRLDVGTIPEKLSMVKGSLNKTVAVKPGNCFSGSADFPIVLSKSRAVMDMVRLKEENAFLNSASGSGNFASE